MILITAFALGYFALAIMVINMGQRRRHTAAINIGFAAFAVETLYIYFETLGTLLDTALFFLTGGIVLVVLAVLLESVRRRLVAPKRQARRGGAGMKSTTSALLLAVAVLQSAVLGWMLWDRISLLRDGQAILLDVEPVDPRDLFRGDYVILSYPISRMKTRNGRRRRQLQET